MLVDFSRTRIAYALAATLAALTACRQVERPQSSAASSAVLAGDADRTRPPKRPPNFIVIFTDDQGYADVGCFGAEQIATPHLDAMAAQGMRFTSFNSASPVCSPSRAALLTGCYPERVGVTKVLFPERTREGLHPDEETIAEVLRGKGYATACFGKWHLGDEAQFLPTKQGFDEYFGIPYSNDMRIKRGDKRGPPVLRNGKIVEHPAQQSSLTKRYTREALRFIAKHKDEPFFLYLPHTMPHVPLAASKDFRGKSKRGLYGDTIEEIDASVGSILSALRTHGIDENTLVLFTSDNGPWLAKGKNGGSAKPLRDGKFTSFEGGVRVPCIARWPGRIPAGQTCDEVASTIDVLPTLCELAGAKRSARKIDGASLVALLEGRDDARSPHEQLYYGLDGVREGRWKLLLRGRTTRGQPSETFPALFDLQGDLGESQNLAKDKPQIVARLTTAIRSHRRKIRREARPIGQAIAPAVGPRVLILGDSISMGYTKPVRQLLWGKAQVFRPMRKGRNGRMSPENCAGTDKGVKNIDRWLAQHGGEWDIIHFNFGLHDLKHVHPKTGQNSNNPAHPRQSEVDDYRAQLARITDSLQKTGAKLIFATTTPYPAGVRPLREPRDAERYNDAARSLMRERGIAINDLHGFVKPKLARLQQPKNVHFKPQGSSALARQVAKHIEQLRAK